jgi:hypothetical protein
MPATGSARRCRRPRGIRAASRWRRPDPTPGRTPHPTSPPTPGRTPNRPTSTGTGAGTGDAHGFRSTSAGPHTGPDPVPATLPGKPNICRYICGSCRPRRLYEAARTWSRTSPRACGRPRWGQRRRPYRPVDGDLAQPRAQRALSGLRDDVPDGRALWPSLRGRPPTAPVCSVSKVSVRPARPRRPRWTAIGSSPARVVPRWPGRASGSLTFQARRGRPGHRGGRIATMNVGIIMSHWL